MRTSIIIIGGFLLWEATLGVARLFGGSSAASVKLATVAFVLLWFMVAAANM